jgi:hypothetical protein
MLAIAGLEYGLDKGEILLQFPTGRDSIQIGSEANHKRPERKTDH